MRSGKEACKRPPSAQDELKLFGRGTLGRSEGTVAGFFLDYLYIFLFRQLRTLLGDFQSRHWPSTTRTVESATVADHAYPWVDLRYVYEVEGLPYRGRYKRGFLQYRTAVDFAERLTTGTTLIVRYSPTQPDRSHPRTADQRLATTLRGSLASSQDR